MNILVIIKVNILVCSVMGHIGSPNYVDYLVYNCYHALNIQFDLFETNVFLVSILEATPNHILLKYKTFIE